jgi:hypothetical protein
MNLKFTPENVYYEYKFPDIDFISDELLQTEGRHAFKTTI